MNANPVNFFCSPRCRTLLYVGAGDGNALDLAGLAELDRITLVEPHPDLAELLVERFSDNKRLNILRTAVSPDGKTAKLALFNFAELSSLCAPAAIREHFPGLRPEGEVAVQTQTLKQLLETHNISDKPALLVLDVAGVEKDILEKTDDEALQALEQIVVFTGDQPLYAGAGTVDDIVSRLEGVQFELVSRGKDELGRVRLTFVNNQKAIILEHKVESERQTRKKAEQDVKSLKAECDRLNSDIEKAAESERVAKKKAEQDIKNLKADYDKACSERKQANVAQQKAEAALETLRVESDELNAAKKTLAENAKTLKTDNKQLADRVKTLEAKLEEGADYDQALKLEFVRMEAQLELMRELMRRDGNDA